MFGLSTLAIQAIAAAALAVGAFGAGVKWSNGQHAIAEVARQETVRIQAAAHRATERQQATQVQEATNASRKREILARADAVGARSALDSLRSALGSNVGACTATDSAGVVRADPARELLSECGQALTELAATADRLDSDRRTLIDAWPK